MKKLLLIMMLCSVVSVVGRSRYVEHYTINKSSTSSGYDTVKNVLNGEVVSLDTVLTSCDQTGATWINYTADSIKYTKDKITFGKQYSLSLYGHDSSVVSATCNLGSLKDLSMYDYFVFTIHIEDSIMNSRLKWNFGALLFYFSGASNFGSAYRYGDHSSTNTTRIDLRYMSNPTDGWYTIGISKKDAALNIVGTPDWSSIQYVRILLRGKGTGNFKVNLQQIKMCKTPLQKGNIIFTIDDGNVSTYDVSKKIFDRYDIKPTIFINGSTINKSGFLSKSNLDTLYANKWEIGNHTWSHARLIDVSNDSVDYEISTGLNYLKNNGYHTYPLFAYPYGKNNRVTDSIAKKYFLFNRTVNGQTIKNIPPHEPYSTFITQCTYSTTPLYDNYFNIPGLCWDSNSVYSFNGAVKPLIDSAINNKLNVGVLFHAFHNTGKKYLSIDTTTLDSILSYVKGKIDLGVLTANPMGKYLLHSPDSCISVTSVSSTVSSYTVNIAISSDADSMKVLLYDSTTNGSWGLRDSTNMLKGGSNTFILRSGLPYNTRYFYKLVGRSNTGTLDSSLSVMSVTLPITSRQSTDTLKLNAKHFGTTQWLQNGSVIASGSSISLNADSAFYAGTKIEAVTGSKKSTWQFKSSGNKRSINFK